jgi:hypothetical protein
MCINSRSFSLLLLCLMASACGHETNLIRPKEIPAYEKKRQEKRDSYAPYRTDNASPSSPNQKP